MDFAMVWDWLNELTRKYEVSMKPWLAIPCLKFEPEL
jgi:hypothetical protein